MTLDLELGLRLALPALLFGVGAGLLGYAAMRARARAATSRRLAEVVGLPTGAEPEMEAPVRSRWRALRAVWLPLANRPAATTRGAVAVGLLAMLMGLVSGTVAWFSLGGLAAAVVVWVGRAGRVRRDLERQAPAAIEMIAAGLRAGFSVPQAVALVARESPQPTRAAFAQAHAEMQVGASLAEALAGLAERTGLRDYALVSTIIWIQAQVGGNLAVLLDSVVATLRQRLELREQVLAVTAQQRMASMVLSLLPVGVLLLLLAIDRPFVQPLFEETAGRVLLAIGSVLLMCGWAALRALSKIEL